MSRLLAALSLLLLVTPLSSAQQQCYYGPGASNRGPSNLVPCQSSGTSACCLLGDTCLSGNACFNYATGNTYQYGCTDITYTDQSCPYKCGWDPTLSPWSGMIDCSTEGISNTWACHSPESCGCTWKWNASLFVLGRIGCQEMGSNARVAVYAPDALPPYVSLPASQGGSTGYYSSYTASGSFTWVATAISGFTPTPVVQFATYSVPHKVVQINSGDSIVLTSSAVSSSPTGTSTIPTTTSPTTTSPSTASPSTTSSTTTDPTSSISTSLSTPSSSTTANLTDLSTGSHGLSTGAAAGIGVAAALIFVAIVALAALCFLRHRRRKTQDQVPQLPQPEQDTTKAGMFSSQISPIQSDYQPGWQSATAKDSVQHIPSPMVSEMDSTSPVHSELPANHRISELGSHPSSHLQELP